MVIGDKVKKDLDEVIEEYLRREFAGIKQIFSKEDFDRFAQMKREFRLTGQDSRQRENVKSNIRYRAEMREKRGARFPNIASVLTGGAGSPIGYMGQMQKQAAQPFKNVWDYKKAEEEHAEKKKIGIGKPGGYLDKDAEDYAQADVEGKKRGTSGSLMGKRMQGMIGKVGKFMESGKGQGMMAGGMMGASILTMIIKKAMEASPMLQQMLKIMNVAMTLFLRPIGDFIGGMLKPIMLFFLREVAIPMLQKGKGMIRMGEEFGKALMGLLLKPVETIMNAIVLAIDKAGLGVLLSPDERTKREGFSGMKEWMSEQKLTSLAIQMGMGSIEKVMEKMRGGKLAMSTQGSATGVGGNLPGGITLADLEAMTDSKGNSLLDQFKKIQEEQRANTYKTVTNMYGGGGTGSGNVASGIGAVSSSFTTLNDRTGELVAGFQGLINLIPGQTVVGGKSVPTGSSGNETYGWNTGLENQGVKHNTPGGNWNTGLEGQGVNTDLSGGEALWNNKAVYDTVPKMLAAFGRQVMEGLKDPSVIDEFGNVTQTEKYKQARADYEFMTTYKGKSMHGSQSPITALEAIQKLFENNKQVSTNMTKEVQQFSDNVVKSGTMLENSSEVIATSMENSAGNIVSAESAVQSLLASIASSSTSSQGYYKGHSYYGGPNVVSGGGYTNAVGVASYLQNTGGSSWGMQHGGMINEPIFGIGKSGQKYTFGEAGREMVTPMFGDKAKGGGSIGPVNINVNIDSVKDDVDLEKIKPIVERALQEVHARRGII